MSTGHPSNHGFRRCNWCDCWRRADAVTALVYGQRSPWLCTDTAWCQAEQVRQVRLGGTPRGPVLDVALSVDANGDAS